MCDADNTALIEGIIRDGDFMSGVPARRVRYATPRYFKYSLAQPRPCARAHHRFDSQLGQARVCND